jgi:hypothetical protein
VQDAPAQAGSAEMAYESTAFGDLDQES